MKLRTLKRTLTGLALLASASAVGCGTSDKTRPFPRLDVAAVIDDKPAASSAEDELAAEHLVNQQINVGHKVASVAEPKVTPGKPTLRDRFKFGRKTDKTLNDISADPFLDDLDQMMAEKTDQVESAAANVDDVFNNTIADARRDAESMFGPEPALDSPDFDRVDTPKSRTESVDPFADIDLAAAQAGLGAPAKPKSGELETAIFGGEEPANDKFDRFLQQSAKPFDPVSTVPQAKSDPKKTAAAFDPFNNGAEVSLEPDVSEFEPFKRASRNDAPGDDLAEFEPAAAAEEPELPPAVSENKPLPAPSLEMPTGAFNPPAEPIEVPTSPQIVPELTVPNPDNVAVTANAPKALPGSEPYEDVPAAVAENAPASAEDRSEVDPFSDPTFFDSAPAVAEDPFADDTEFAPNQVPQFRTANRRVTIEPVDTSLAVEPVSQAVAQTTVPALATEPAPSQKMVLVQPGEWTAWFLIAGLVTVALLLFAPGRGRS